MNKLLNIGVARKIERVVQRGRGRRRRGDGREVKDRECYHRPDLMLRCGFANRFHSAYLSCNLPG